MQKLTQEEFIKKAQEANPNLDFSKSIYKDGRSSIIITCPKHGDFEVLAKSALRTLTCPKCDYDSRVNNFITKAREIHGDKYNYSKIQYKTNKIPVEIVCPEHGSFMQAPGDHLPGYGCSKCSGKYKPTGAEWIKQAAPVYNYKYDYSKVEYKDNKTSVIVICPEHGEFKTIPTNHIKGVSGCPKCNDILKHEKFRKTTELFIEDAIRIHGNKYDYSKVIYCNKSTPVTIICPIHGEFKQNPDNHLAGRGCPRCLHKTQNTIYEYLINNLKDINIEFEVGSSVVPWITSLRFDMFIPDYNIAIEYDGELHFRPIEHFGGKEKYEQVIQRDKVKNQLCKDNKCILIRIKYTFSLDNLKDIIDYINTIIQLKSEDKTYYENIKYFD